MAGTQIIRSTDSAAVSASAILTGNAGSLVAVLDYALVTVLGWGKTFSATNKAVYRAASGARHYLDVDDSGPDGTALGRNARCRGYETMSAVATGTNPFPTTAQAATTVGLVKSTATGTTARPWIIIGDERTFYMFSSAGGTDPPTLSTNAWTDGFYFGEILSLLSGDSYRSVLSFTSTTTAIVAASALSFGAVTSNTSTGAALTAMPRTYTGSGAAIWAAGVGNLFSAATPSISGDNNQTGTGADYPNPVDGGLYANLIAVFERGSGTTPVGITSGKGLRGYLRGLYGTYHSTTGYNDQDTFTGVAGFSGKTFMALKFSGQGMFLFDTGTWAFSS